MFERVTAIPKQPLQIASCLIFNDRGQLLLLRRHADDLGGGLWAAPGGKQELDEDAALTAVRETEEETGIALSEVTYLGTHELRMPHGVVHIRSFAGRVAADQVVTIDFNEHTSHDWFEPASLTGTDNIIWGLPTMLLDFGLLATLEVDPTLSDGSQAILLERSAHTVDLTQ